MKRIAVLGGTGMAGHVIATYLEEHGYDVYITSRSATETPKSRMIDVSNFTALAAWLDEINPDVIVNCIGILPNVADVRPDLAIMLNAYLPRWIAYKYKSAGIKLIHLSTDCVFSGTKGGYTETDIPDGTTIYDRSKALGEVADDKNLTFRMSIIGPDKHENGTGLFNWFMKQQGSINGYTKAIWNGITTIELARAINEAVKQDLTGLYQLTPGDSIDKYHLLLLFKDIFNKTDITVNSFEGFSSDKTLVNTRTDFNFEIRDYRRQVAEMRLWIDDHKNFYKQY